MYSNGNQGFKNATPGKRMKKRKELDALIVDRSRNSMYQPLHKPNSRISGFGSHSSCAPEMNYAPMKPYGNISKRHLRNEGHRLGCTSKRVFHICLPTCVLALLAACVTSSVGIVWMQLQLKSDLDHIQERLFRIERWKADQPSTIADLQDVAKQLQQDVSELKESNQDISAIKSQLTSINSRVEKQTALDYTQVITTMQNHFVDLQNSVSDMSMRVSKLQQSVQSIDTANQLSTAKTSQLIQRLNEEVNKGADDSNAATARDHQAIETALSRIQVLEDSMNESEKLSAKVGLLTERQSTCHDGIVILQQRVSSLNSSVTSLLDFDAETRARLSRAEQTILTLNSDPSPHEQRAHSSAAGGEVRPGLKADVNQAHDKERVPNQRQTPMSTSSTEATLPHQHNGEVRVGDTTTSFTQLPTGKHNTAPKPQKPSHEH